MRVITHITAPGMQPSHHSYVTADEPGIFGQFLQCRGLGKIGIYICLLILIAIASIPAKSLNKAILSNGWPKVEGKIIASKVGTSGKAGNAFVNTFPFVQYVYQVEGVQYTNQRIFFVPDGRTHSWCEEKIKRYPVGKQVLVYIKPGDPNISVLEPGWHFTGIWTNGIACFLIMLPFLLLSGVLLWDYRRTINKLEISMTI